MKPYQTIDISSDLQIAYTGPDLSTGPLPALFYFALSAHDSLALDPFNQPIVYLSGLPLRIFSLTLPGHENNRPPTKAIEVWAEEIAQGKNLIASFIDQIKRAFDFLLNRGVLIPEKIGAAGLSRGAFIATHAAAQIPEIQTILGFAPLTNLSFAKEFHSLLHLPLVHALALEHLVDPIATCNLRFYIGNHDVCVSTRLCFDFIDKLSQCAFHKLIRSPQVELIIRPSIGHLGHGTSKQTFHEGAQWIAEKLGAIDVL